MIWIIGVLVITVAILCRVCWRLSDDVDSLRGQAYMNRQNFRLLMKHLNLQVVPGEWREDRIEEIK